MQIGLERFIRRHGQRFRGSKVGVICHQASVSDGFQFTPDRLIEAGDWELAALFGPQHGAWGEKQDDMVESDSFTDVRLGIPVHSLYGSVRKPTPGMLQGLDVLLFDLQDVGVRVYTFVWTMTLAMSACGDAGVRFIVLDRPNPITGVMRDGPVLREGFESFVGLHRIPLRHGLTVGEVARLVRNEFGVECDLEVVSCDGWRREQWLDETGLPFVSPSPNIPTLDSMTVYPGMVLMEGTNLSEGRGTTRPFEFVGAPFINPHTFARMLGAYDLPGVVFRPCYFEPTFQKHAGKLCGGVQIHVVDRSIYRAVETAVCILTAARTLAPDEFAWRQPPYEYETVRMPIDLLWGSTGLREMIETGTPPKDIMATCVPELQVFDDLIRPWLLY